MRSRFANRSEAGKLLAQAVMKLRLSNPVVYALPRGGVPVAAQVAEALHAPLDVLFVRKIGLPREPGMALGAVVDGDNPVTVWNDDVVEMAGLPPARLDALRSAQLAHDRPAAQALQRQHSSRRPCRSHGHRRG